MVSPERRKGAGWEVAVVKYFAEHGFPYVERSYGAGRPDDCGDLDGLPGWCAELKNHKTMDLAGWMDEAEREALNAGAPWACVIAKRRNKPTGDAYVVMNLTQFVDLLAEVEEIRRGPAA